MKRSPGDIRFDIFPLVEDFFLESQRNSSNTLLFRHSLPDPWIILVPKDEPILKTQTLIVNQA